MIGLVCEGVGRLWRQCCIQRENAVVLFQFLVLLMFLILCVAEERDLFFLWLHLSDLLCV